jgi:hypothetical protein
MKTEKYYIYAYLDPTKKGNFKYTIEGKIFIFEFEPFYIGRGTKNRLLDHLKLHPLDKNYFKKNKIKKIKKLNIEPIIVKVKFLPDKIKANLLEKEFISVIGRRDLNLGPLTNLTDGGDGTYGYKPSEEAKRNWKKSIKKFYDVKENRDRMGYYSTIEGMIEKYGIVEGEKKYKERIRKMKKSINKTYSDPKIRKKCSNKGSKNGMFGITPPHAKKVLVMEVFYNSIAEASKHTKVPYTTLSQRLNSKNFSEYKYL